MIKNDNKPQRDSLYGNEEKCLFQGRFAPSSQIGLQKVLAKGSITVLNVSCWDMRSSWRVPSRRIYDHLLLFVAEGTLVLRTGKRSFEFSRGSMVCIPELVEHSYGFADGCSRGRLFVLHCLGNVSWQGSLFSELGVTCLEISHADAVLEELADIVAIKNWLRKEAFSLAEGLIKRVLLTAIRERSLKLTAGRTYSPRVATALQFIHDHLMEGISVADIAHSVGLQEVHFRNVFRRECGLSPLRALNHLRLQQAARLLVRSAEPLSKVAEQCGFATATYFCQVFRKHFRQSPDQFRHRF